MANYRYKDFLPIQTLAEKKHKTGKTVSLIIPAFNEAATIGTIITAARKELLDNHGLVDEIIVMDGASTDTTRQVSELAGAQVYNVQDVVPQIRSPQGKGNALWRSQFVAKGDICVCVDADICNFDCRFIYGLLGPFFENPEIVYSKAFYARPLVLENHMYQNYGGRVTEILVRPMLCAFMPELACIQQPLSGEYAFLRKAMQDISFSSGYGVEIGLLFDCYKNFGLDRIAQVNMDTRCHRNRPVLELGQMSLGIIQTMMRRLEQEQKLSLKIPFHNDMISAEGHGIEKVKIEEVELPPYNSIRGTHDAR